MIESPPPPDSPRPALPRHTGGGGAGYTLIEMLTTVAALVLILGLMVSLARFVRYRSSTDLTEDLLVQCRQSMERYVAIHDRMLPDIPPAVPDGDPNPTEGLILSRADANNRAFVRVLRAVQPVRGGLFADLSVSLYDGQTLRDAWGGLILYMPHQHPAIGIAPHNQFFFFSAGPDRRYLTRDDNLYSYEGR